MLFWLGAGGPFLKIHYIKVSFKHVLNCIIDVSRRTVPDGGFAEFESLCFICRNGSFAKDGMWDYVGDFFLVKGYLRVLNKL